MKKLLVAAIVVLMASPAFAAVQNVKVSGDITSTYLDRQSFDLGFYQFDPAALKNQSVFLTQTRVRVDADLTDNVSTTVGLINERSWNQQSDNSTDNNGVDLYLASVTMRELLYSPLTVTVGRQVFNYGNGLIIGDGGPNNGTLKGGLRNIAGDMTMGTTYDGVKAILDYKPLTIDMFYFKNKQTDISTQGLYNTNEENSNVYGLNANYQLGDAYNTVLEGYMFTRFDGDNVNTPTVTDKGNSLYVPGLRASTNPVKGLNVQGEVAWQLGNQVVATQTAAQALAGTTSQEAEHRDAMAAQLMATYSLPVLEKYKPTVNVSDTYVSGDKNANKNYSSDAVKSAKVFGSWDEFNKSQGSGTIYNTLFPLSNMNILEAGASINPLQDVTTSATWSNLMAMDKESEMTLLQPNGDSGVVPVRNKKALGNEVDLNVNYAYTEDVNFGLSVGWFVPGDAFYDQTRNTASQAIASVGVKF